MPMRWGCFRRVGLPAAWRRMLRSGSLQRGTSRSTGRSASSVGDTWQILSGCLWTLSGLPAEVLADAGNCNEADLAAPEARGIRGHVALGREGRKHAAIDRNRRPATHRMEEHVATPQGRAAYAERMDQGGSRVPSVPCAGPEEGAGRMVPGLPCAEHSADVGPGDGLTGLARHPESTALHKYPRNP